MLTVFSSFWPSTSPSIMILKSGLTGCANWLKYWIAIIFTNIPNKPDQRWSKDEISEFRLKLFKTISHVIIFWRKNIYLQEFLFNQIFFSIYKISSSKRIEWSVAWESCVSNSRRLWLPLSLAPNLGWEYENGLVKTLLNKRRHLNTRDRWKRITKGEIHMMMILF